MRRNSRKLQPPRKVLTGQSHSRSIRLSLASILCLLMMTIRHAAAVNSYNLASGILPEDFGSSSRVLTVGTAEYLTDDDFSNVCLFSGLAGDYLRLYFPSPVTFKTILVGKHASQTTDFIPIEVHFGEDTIRTNNAVCPAAGHGIFSCTGTATYVFIALA